MSPNTEARWEGARPRKEREKEFEKPSLSEERPSNTMLHCRTLFDFNQWICNNSRVGAVEGSIRITLRE